MGRLMNMIPPAHITRRLAADPRLFLVHGSTSEKPGGGATHPAAPLSVVREPLAPTHRIVADSIPPPTYNTHNFPHLTLAPPHSNLQLTYKGLSSEKLRNLLKVSQQRSGRMRPRNGATQACGLTIGWHCLHYGAQRL